MGNISFLSSYALLFISKAGLSILLLGKYPQVMEEQKPKRFPCDMANTWNCAGIGDGTNYMYMGL